MRSWARKRHKTQRTKKSLNKSIINIYIYTHIYISRDLMQENMRFCGAFFAKKIGIFSNATLEIKTN